MVGIAVTEIFIIDHIVMNATFDKMAAEVDQSVAAQEHPQAAALSISALRTDPSSSQHQNRDRGSELLKIPDGQRSTGGDYALDGTVGREIAIAAGHNQSNPLLSDKFSGTFELNGDHRRLAKL